MPYEHCSPPSLAGPGWGRSWVSLYPPRLPVVVQGGGTHGSPIPLYVSLSVCGFSAGPPYTHQGNSCGGMPPRHYTWLWVPHSGGTSPLPYVTPYPKTHSCSGSSLSRHPTVNPVGGGGTQDHRYAEEKKLVRHPGLGRARAGCACTDRALPEKTGMSDVRKTNKRSGHH